MLTPETVDEIVRKSARSYNPLSEDALRDVAQAGGCDPDEVVEEHQRIVEELGPRDQPMPVILPD